MGIASLPRLASRTLRPPLLPIPATPGDLDLPFEQIWLQSPTGTRVHAWFIPAELTGPAVIVMHGWTANSGLMLPLAQPLRDAGFNVLFIDGRGHGYSEPDEFMGSLQFSEDIEAGLELLRADDRVTTLGILGHSAGGSAAILAASRQPDVQAVVAVAAVADPRLIRWGWLPQRTQEAFLQYVSRRTGYRTEEIIPTSRISHIRAPILLIHGELDEIVPIQHSRLLAEAATDADLLILPEGDHSSLEKFAPAGPRLIEFFRRHL